MKNRSYFTPYYFLVAGVLLQGLSPVFTKLLLSDLSHATVVAARYLLAVAFLFPFGYHHRTVPKAPGRPTRRDWVALFLVGALGSGVGALLFTAALDNSHAGIVNAISKTAPIFVCFFAYFTLRERITWGRVSLVVMMVAADVFIAVGELSLGTAAARQYLLGDALALGAGITRAAAEILGKNALKKFAPATVALWRFGIGCLITGVISLSTGQYLGLMQLDTQGWIILFVLAGVSTSLSMALYYRGLAEVPAHVAVTLKLLGAIVTAIVSWIVLHEALNAYHIAGIAVLVFGAYLIVMRTAAQRAEGTEREIETAGGRPWTASLRNRIALLVAAAIIVTVFLGTWLAIRHSRAVIEEQARISMIETGYMVLQYQTIGETLGPDRYEHLLQRLAKHKIRGQVYSVDIVYVMLLDGRGDLIAFGADPDFQKRTAEGRLLHPDRAILGRQLLDLVRSEAVRKMEDLQPMSIELEGYPQLLKMGYRRSITGRVAAEISARYFTLAVLLIIAGVLVTIYFVGRMVSPLEKLTVAAGRIASGDLEVPVTSEGAEEIDSLSRSIARIAQDLQVASMVRRSMFRAATGGTSASRENGPLPPVILVVDMNLSGEVIQKLSEQHATEYSDAVIGAVNASEGEFFDYGGGRIVAAWGRMEREMDDVLRATVAGLQIVDSLRDSNLPEKMKTARLMVDVLPQTPPQNLLETLEEGTRMGERLPALYLSPAAFEEVRAHVSAKAIARGKFYKVLGLSEEDAMEQIAASPDE